MTSLKIIFAGTPAFAAQHLQALLNSHHQVVAVYTQPDKPAGRGKKLQASPVKQLAEQHNIPVYQPKSLRKVEAQEEMRAIDADVMVVVAYGLILPQTVLAMPRLGCLNVHGLLLPRWRGRRRFNVPFGLGINKRVSLLCKWMKDWIRVICCIKCIVILRRMKHLLVCMLN